MIIPGVSYVPIVPGEKRPAIRSWRRFQKRKASRPLILQWLSKGFWLGAVCGRVSGGLEVFDFDCAELFQDWLREASDLLRIEQSYIVETPKGFHFYLRHTSVGPSELLAGDEAGRVLIETRGEGAYAVAPSETNDLYKLWHPCPPFPPLVPVQMAHRLRLLAKRFDRRPSGRAWPSSRGQKGGSRVGDIFNRRMTWDELLPRYGWQHFMDLHRDSRKLTHWTRPGKDSGISGTSGVGEAGDLFHCFTSAAPPLEQGQTYDKFGFYALVQHCGNFGLATASLARQGYVPREGEG